MLIHVKTNLLSHLLVKETFTCRTSLHQLQYTPTGTSAQYARRGRHQCAGPATTAPRSPLSILVVESGPAAVDTARAEVSLSLSGPVRVRRSRAAERQTTADTDPGWLAGARGYGTSRRTCRRRPPLLVRLGEMERERERDRHPSRLLAGDVGCGWWY